MKPTLNSAYHERGEQNDIFTQARSHHPHFLKKPLGNVPPQRVKVKRWHPISRPTKNSHMGVQTTEQMAPGVNHLEGQESRGHQEKNVTQNETQKTCKTG